MTIEEQDEKDFDEWKKREYGSGVLDDNEMGKMVSDYMLRSWLASRRTLRVSRIHELEEGIK